MSRRVFFLLLLQQQGLRRFAVCVYQLYVIWTWESSVTWCIDPPSLISVVKMVTAVSFEMSNCLPDHTASYTKDSRVSDDRREVLKFYILGLHNHVAKTCFPTKELIYFAWSEHNFVFGAVFRKLNTPWIGNVNPPPLHLRGYVVLESSHNANGVVTQKFQSLSLFSPDTPNK